MASLKKGGVRPARRRVILTPGDAVRVGRELQELSQVQLSELSGLTQPTISSIETGRAPLGLTRATILARALKVHPAVLLFPQWEEEEQAPKKRAASR